MIKSLVFLAMLAHGALAAYSAYIGQFWYWAASLITVFVLMGTGMYLEVADYRLRWYRERPKGSPESF